MKPDTPTAMNSLLGQIREVFPFEMPEADICAGTCTGCPKKLLEFLGSEVDGWECKLADGENPTFGDLDRLAKCSQKIYTSLQKNQLV